MKENKHILYFRKIQIRRLLCIWVIKTCSDFQVFQNLNEDTLPEAYECTSESLREYRLAVLLCSLTIKLMRDFTGGPAWSQVWFECLPSEAQYGSVHITPGTDAQWDESIARTLFYFKRYIELSVYS